MADCCQAAQLNVYRRSAFRPDNRIGYQQFLSTLSWSSTPENVPQQARVSFRPKVTQGFYSHLHPSIMYDDGSALGIRHEISSRSQPRYRPSTVFNRNISTWKPDSPYSSQRFSAISPLRGLSGGPLTSPPPIMG